MQLTRTTQKKAIPELHLNTPLADTHGKSQWQHPQNWAPSGPLASPEYVASSSGSNLNKRRRISDDDEGKSLRAHQVPRLYPSPEHPAPRQLTPPSARPTSTGNDRWSSQTAPQVYNSPVSSRPSNSVDYERRDSRASLSSLPPLSGLDRARDNYTAYRGIESPSSSGPIKSPIYSGSHYDYPYSTHHSRHQSLSGSSVHHYDRSPFTASTYGSHHGDSRYGDMGPMGDAKQRKRRGNLPKETTDKLRTWFVAHLQHPYPTEDEKQDLMRQTGLQMNQISNWFINARRRQLPAIINNARAETDAMKRKPSTEGERSDIGADAGYDDMDTLARHRAADLKRESI